MKKSRTILFRLGTIIIITLSMLFGSTASVYAAGNAATSDVNITFDKTTAGKRLNIYNPSTGVKTGTMSPATGQEMLFVYANTINFGVHSLEYTALNPAPTPAPKTLTSVPELIGIQVTDIRETGASPTSISGWKIQAQMGYFVDDQGVPAFTTAADAATIVLTGAELLKGDAVEDITKTQIAATYFGDSGHQVQLNNAVTLKSGSTDVTEIASTLPNASSEQWNTDAAWVIRWKNQDGRNIQIKLADANAVHPQTSYTAKITWSYVNAV